MTDERRGKKPGRGPRPERPQRSEDAAGKLSTLSEADQALWRRITESARPLSRRRPAQPAEEKPPETYAETPVRPAAAKRLQRAEPVPLQPKRPKPPDLAAGDMVGVARSQADRLRRGRLPIEARLDLHGHSQEKAHRALDAFLARAQDRGKRCVLVVTGKGTTKDQGGVLRRMVPLWLNEPPNRERVLLFDQAQPKDGGQGALYVLLKRRRSP